MQASLRTIFELLAATGSCPDIRLDTDEDPLGGGVLRYVGLDARREEVILLDASASEQAVTLSNAILVILLSDEPFDIKRAAGETAWTKVRHFIVAGDSTANAVCTTSFVLDGNGTNQAKIRALIIEKPQT